MKKQEKRNLTPTSNLCLSANHLEYRNLKFVARELEICNIIERDQNNLDVPLSVYKWCATHSCQFWLYDGAFFFIQ